MDPRYVLDNLHYSNQSAVMLPYTFPNAQVPYQVTFQETDLGLKMSRRRLEDTIVRSSDLELDILLEDNVVFNLPQVVSEPPPPHAFIPYTCNNKENEFVPKLKVDGKQKQVKAISNNKGGAPGTSRSKGIQPRAKTVRPVPKKKAPAKEVQKKKGAAKPSTSAFKSLSKSKKSPVQQPQKAEENIHERRREQNRIASARFRQRNRTCRLQVEGLEQNNDNLKKDNAQFKRKFKALNEEIALYRANEARLLSLIEKPLEEAFRVTMENVKKHYWLRRKISFKTLATCVTAFSVRKRQA